jgi:hypothetical protein
MTDSKSKVPEKNTSQWKKNEKLINENPVLKHARDTAEGIEKPAGHYKNNSGQWHGGKGSTPRVNTNSKQYRDNFDRIFGKKDK